MAVRARLVCLGTLAIVAGAPETAAACSCAGEPITAETFRQSDGAVIGRLVDIHVRGPDPEPGEPFPAARPADFEYRVARVFRGRRRIETAEPLLVRSNTSEAACGLPASKGRRYGLFLDRSGGRWNGGLCATTSPRQMRRAAERTGFARTAACAS